MCAWSSSSCAGARRASATTSTSASSSSARSRAASDGDSDRRRPRGRPQWRRRRTTAPLHRPLSCTKAPTARAAVQDADHAGPRSEGIACLTLRSATAEYTVRLKQPIEEQDDSSGCRSKSSSAARRSALRRTAGRRNGSNSGAADAGVAPPTDWLIPQLGNAPNRRLSRVPVPVQSAASAIVFGPTGVAERNAASSSASFAFAASRCRSLTWPYPRMCSGICASSTASV